MLRRGDDRAVSALVGAVLLLGIFVVALSMYQLNVVPNENYEVEVNHNERVQGDLQELRNTVVSVPGGNSGGSTTVTLGATYSERTFTVNPPPASGTLRTEELGEISIKNAEIDGNSGFDENGYWSRTTYSFEYVPDYNEYQNAPETVYEHGLLYNHHPNDAAISLADQIVVDGDEITIVTLQGDVSESSSGSVSVDSRAFSTSSNTVSLESDSDEPLTITLPTSSPSHWNETLSDAEYVIEDSIEEDEEHNQVEFKLKSGKYDLQMAEVGVGDATRERPEERVEYIELIDNSAPTAVVEVRDRFNNPVRNAPIKVKVDGDERKTSTGSDGQVRIPELTGDEDEITVTANEVDISFGVESSGSGDEKTPPYDVFWHDPSNIEGNEDSIDPENCDDESCVVTGDQVELEMGTDDVADGANVEYAVSNQTVGTVDPEGTTDADGTSTTTFSVADTASDGDSVKVYTSSGSDGDMINLEIDLEETGDIDFNAEDISDETQTFTFDVSESGLGNEGQAFIDLTDPQSNGGVEYENARLENGGNDDISYNSETGMITYTVSGQPSNDQIEITIDARGGEEGTYTVDYSDDEDNEDSDTFTISGDTEEDISDFDRLEATANDDGFFFDYTQSVTLNYNVAPSEDVNELEFTVFDEDRNVLESVVVDEQDSSMDLTWSDPQFNFVIVEVVVRSSAGDRCLDATVDVDETVDRNDFNSCEN